MTPLQKRTLSQQQQKLVRRASKLLYLFLDRYQYGSDIDGYPRPVYKTKTLMRFYQRSPKGISCHLAKLTDRHIAEHLFGTTRYYYVSSQLKRGALIGFDLDTHNGQTDQDEAAQLLTELVPKLTYFESSTNNRGLHGYLFIDKGGIGNAYDLRIRNACLTLGRHLGSLLNVVGIQTTLEIKGYPATYQPNGVFIRGPMIKIPMLRTEELFDDFCSIESIELELFEQVAKDFEEEAQAGEVITDYGHAAHIRGFSDARNRWIGSAQFLARQLTRIPTVDELEAFYVNNHLYSPPLVDPQRRDHLAEAIELVAKDFAPEKCRSRRYGLGDYLPLVRKHINQEDIDTAICLTIRKVKDRRPFTHTDLDICLGFHTTTAFEKVKPDRYWQTCPSSGIEGLFATLKEQGKHDRTANKHKVRAMRRALVNADLIQCLDDKWHFRNGKGRSQLWGLGEKHPLYEQWQQVAYSPYQISHPLTHQQP